MQLPDAIIVSDNWITAALDDFENSPNDAILVIPPNQITPPASRFFVELKQSLGVMMLLVDATTFADNASYIASIVVDGKKEVPTGFNPLKKLSPEKGMFEQRLHVISQPLLQMILVRIMDNFTTYLVEIVRECLKSRPEILISSEQITYETVLRHSTIEELRDYIVETKIDKLAYLGFAKLADWIERKMKINHLNCFPARTALIQVLEARNCIVHNRSRIGKKFLRAVDQENELACRIGNEMKTTVDLVYLATRATAECVTIIDEALAEKFNLSREPSA